VILQAIEASDNDIDMSTCTLHSTVVPELGVSDQTMNEALATLNPPTERKRPSRMKAWWKFW
jgi:hypothetical protein